ncbi:hypothetical protein ACP275_08G158700 [Erythranthe tilingii]
MADIPSELIEDISAPSLNHRRSLIDSDRFVKSHLRRSLTSLSNRHLITAAGASFCSVALDSLDKAHAIKPPFDCKSGDGISNSCNGIVLVTSDPPVLWNPFSRDYKILPDFPAEFVAPAAYHSKATYGFGYDSRNDDYKVVRVLEFRRTVTHIFMASEVKIYSLKSDSWRRIEPLPYPIQSSWGSWRVHVNGVLHSVVRGSVPENESRIMCFSLETEKHHRTMMIPNGNRLRGGVVGLNLIDDCLSVVCLSRSGVGVWVMKEYGVDSSWIKLVSVNPPAFERKHYADPLVYSKEGDKVLLNCDNERLVWYDLRKQSVDYVRVDGSRSSFYAEACVESLVSLGGGRGGIKNLGQEKERKKEEIRKKR